ncbi:MAG: GNAT family N-acetyltransferase [Tabrizicola sp.]|nr:GNAT family N-acetyltransferase [Tabrizicola sp.]
MTTAALFRLIEATWPPARTWRNGAFALRDGDGGGKRVSAATCEGDWDETGLSELEAAMAEPLVMVRPGQEQLDRALDARGWQLIDPVVAYAAPVSDLAAKLPPLSAFAHWPPLQIACSIWEEGGIGPERIRVMQRVDLAKCALLARQGDRPSGAAFVACRKDEAMLHALEVRPDYRRQGTGTALMQAAANWARDQGAKRLFLVVTEENQAARALYHRLGMQVVGRYHYRMNPSPKAI